MKIIHAELKIDDCSAELWLNGIPLQRLTPNGSHNISIPAHLYLLDGQNTLEIVVNPGPIPSRAMEAIASSIPKGFALARLAAYEVGDFTGDPKAQILLEVSWDSTTAQPGTYPRTVKTNGNLGKIFGHWAWETSATLTLDTVTINSATAVLEAIRASLEVGDPAVLLQLAENKFANAARAFPARPFNILVDQFRRMVAMDSAEKGWAFPKLDHDQFDFRLVADGRMLECINRDWRPTLRTVALSDGYPKYYQMLLCNIKGRWQVAV